MHSFLSNLSLFAQVLLKVGMYCGFGPGIVIACALSTRGKNLFWSPISVGKLYRVEGYYLGEFVCEIREFDRDNATVLVTDPLRPMPRVRNRCCFPACVREDFHGGDHEFVRVREGAMLEVPWRLAKWIPESSGGGQLAKPLSSGSMSSRSTHPLNRATSPPRKERRYA